MNTSDIIKCIITIISAIDFIVFIIYFMKFMSVIPYKSKQLSTKIGSILVIICFIIFKAMHVPMFLLTISIINYEIPYSQILLQVLAYINISLIAIPLYLAIYTSYILNKKTDLRNYDKNKVKIIMPIYNEEPVDLYNAIKSILNLNYNKKNIHVYLAFDEDNETPAYKYILEKFGIPESKPKITIDIEGILISICKFKHGGKKSAQYGAFKEIENDYTCLNHDYLFFIDSDIILDKNCLLEFNYYAEKNNKNCLTGMITCIASNKPTFLTYYQDIEYISGQIFWRNFETILGGASTCLPGAFTFLKYSSLKKVSDIYFKKVEYQDITDYHRFYLGEDRYLTHLLMESEPWKIGFCEKAKCKTNGPKTLQSLLKQRRRWALGHIANSTWMMSSIKLWELYPILSLFNFFNNARNSSIYIYLLYFIVLFNSQITLITYLLFIILPIVLNYIFIIFYAVTTRRRMNILFYIIIVILEPIFNMMYLYYSIYTINKQTWGGIRTKPELKKIITQK